MPKMATASARDEEYQPIPVLEVPLHARIKRAGAGDAEVLNVDKSGTPVVLTLLEEEGDETESPRMRDELVLVRKL